MEIIARSRSSDPVQEALREHKSNWNQAASHLITELIALKRGLNGKGDPRSGIPASSIKEELPSQVGSYLHNITEQFSSLVSGAEAIEQEQKEYAHNRRQPQQHQQTTQQPQHGFQADDGLTSEASWAGSQLWAKTFGLRGEQGQNYKLILNALIAMKKDLLDMENYITSSSSESIHQAVNRMINIGLNDFSMLMKGYNGIANGKNALPQYKEPPQLPPTKPPPQPQIQSLPAEIQKENIEAEPVEAITPPKENEPATTEGFKVDELISLLSKEIQPMHTVLKFLIKNNFVQKETIKPFLFGDKELTSIIKAKKKWDKLTIAKQQEIIDLINAIKRSYYDLLNITKKELPIKDANKFMDFMSAIKVSMEDKLKEQEKQEQVKKAHNSMSRYLKRQWLNRPFFRSSKFDDLKVYIASQIEQAVKTINVFLDAVEKKQSRDGLKHNIRLLNSQLKGISEDTLNLANLYNSEINSDPNNKNLKLIRQVPMLNKLLKTLDAMNPQLTMEEMLG